MLFFVIGLPGAFGDWCEAVVVRLAQQVFGPVELIHADTLEQLALSAIGTGASQAVVVTRQPGGAMCAALVEHRRNFVVALDDPRTALLDLVLDRGAGLVDSVQAVASASAALTRCTGAAGALVLQRDRDWVDPTLTVFAIARHLGIDIDDASLAGVISDLPADHAVPSRHDAVAWWNTLTANEQAMVSGALQSFVAAPEGDAAMSLSWASELFFVGAGPDERVRGPVDITGRAHRLLTGPYIALPAGSWSLSLSLVLSARAAEREFFVEVWADRMLASSMLPPQRSATGEIRLDFVLDAMTERPLSIQVSTTRAAFDGAIAIGEARLVRAAPPPASAPEAPLALAGQ
jgi:hypothetical protein